MNRSLERGVILLVVFVLTVLASAGLGVAGAEAAGCSTSDPTTDTATGNLQWGSDQAIQTNFSNARAAEGCNSPLTLPAGYDAMSPQQQMLWLFNSEREVRGLGDLSLDPTLASQIALEHSQEMAQYGYFEHQSPINQGQNVDARDTVNPAFAQAAGSGEDIAAGYGTAAEAVFGYMYDDAGSAWGHRHGILGDYNWVGIGVALNAGGQWNNYWTDDFLKLAPGYTPPSTADTGAPQIGRVIYSNGTATVTGVADNPANVNDQGANPVSAGITGVVFYINNISDVNNDGSAYNSVAATQTSAGTWTANIALNTGDVLHAVAVDGSGNYVDMTPPPPPVNLVAGENPVALPAGGAPVAGSAAGPHHGSEDPPAVTPTASDLIHSVDKQARRHVAEFVRVYVRDHWETYYPGRSRDIRLDADEGVILKLKARARWRPPARDERYTVPKIHLHAGWNFVAVPYPITGLSVLDVRSDLGRADDRLRDITIGDHRKKGEVLRPKDGKWGHDLRAMIPNRKGFWIEDTRADTWLASPVAALKEPPRIK